MENRIALVPCWAARVINESEAVDPLPALKTGRASYGHAEAVTGRMASNASASANWAS